MRIIRTVAEMRTALADPRRAGRCIGLVPTMGAFHDGHMSLIKRAREDTDVVVVWLFVNPSQFNDSGDLAAYPRDEGRDADLARAAGVDFLFAPPASEVYPPAFATTVAVAGLTDRLEGEHRGRAHFNGVTTVVAKMLNMVGPNVAYFGQKDAQQAVVVRRMVRDLDMPVRIQTCPTVRAPDGLAISSRNARLSAGDRHRATSLHRALLAVEQAIADGERDPRQAIAHGLAELKRAGAETEYLEIVAPDTMAPVTTISGHVLVVVAARIGDVRLIDNTTVGHETIHLDREVATPAGAPTVA
jgi:pantoate--beta-alanine ligase